MLRHSIQAALLLLAASATNAQQITNVTVTPNPVRECQQLTFHIIGTAPPGMAFTFVTNNVTGNSISLVIEASGPASGATAFNNPMGPYGPFSAGTYALSMSLKYNGTITSTWPGNLTVLPAIPHNIGEPNAISVCTNAAPFQLITRLGGTPEPGGLWLNPQLQPVPSGTFIPGTSPEGDYLYYFDVMPPCDPDYQVLNILNAPNNSPGTSATVPLCITAGTPVTDLFTKLGGTPMAGGTWTGPGGNTSGIFTPGTSLPGPYVYQVPGIAPCANPTATLTVVGVESNAGVGESAVFCHDEAAALLNNYVTGESTTGLWYSPQGTLITFYGQTINLAVNGAGNYAYVVTTAPCPADTAFVTVTLQGPPCTLGIPNLDDKAEGLRVMPNPASRTATVEIERTHPGNGQFLELHDVSGKVLLREKLDAGSSLVRRTLDLSKLAPGAYLLKLVGTQHGPTQRLMVE